MKLVKDLIRNEIHYFEEMVRTSVNDQTAPYRHGLMAFKNLLEKVETLEGSRSSLLKVPNFVEFRRKYPFDRKDGIRPPFLDKLRGPGRGRYVRLLNCLNDPKFINFDERYSSKYYHFKTLSSAMGFAKMNGGWEGKTFIDFGCGSSADRWVALLRGCKRSVGIDLYETDVEIKGSEFIKGDICEELPLEDECADLIVCSAVVDLIKREDRLLMYKNAYRILKKGGEFRMSFVNLSCGHGYSVTEEKAKLAYVGFYLNNFAETVICKK